MATGSGPGVGLTGAAAIPIKTQSLSTIGLDAPGPQWVAIRTEALFGSMSGRVVARLISAGLLGGGGIDPQTRPQARPLTPYNSPESPGITLTILLDGHGTSTSVEPDCRTLERMAGMFLPDDPGPQRLIVHGEAVPHCTLSEAPKHRWVISEQPDFASDPTDSTTLIRNSAGRRTRQQVGLTLLLDTEATELQRVKPRQAAPAYSQTSAKKGDTYEKVAKRELGSARYGGKLAKLNGDRDPTKKLAEGKKVRLPTAHTLDLWKKDLAK